MDNNQFVKFNPTSIEGQVKIIENFPLQVNLVVNGERKTKLQLKSNKGFASYTFQIDNYLHKNRETLFQITYNQESLNRGNNFHFYNSCVHKKKIFFLHIPKTAGSSVNEMLGNYFWSKRVRFHIETETKNKYRNINTNWFKMLSGHTTLHLINQHLPLPNFLRVTLLRDPYSQLISHINWAKHIGRDQNSATFKSYDPNIQEISIKLNEIDFSNSKQVESYLLNLSEFGNRLFNNRQTRSLLNEKAKKAIQITESPQQAIETLHFFDVVGTVEHMNEFINTIQQKMGWKKDTTLLKTNTLNNKYQLNADSESLKKVLEPLYSSDQILYNYVLKGKHLSNDILP